jgi:hypothetical protein
MIVMSRYPSLMNVGRTTRKVTKVSGTVAVENVLPVVQKL